MVGGFLLGTGDIGGVTVMVILAWHAAGWDLVQSNRGVRPLLGNVDLAEHCGGVRGVVVLVLGSSFAVIPGSGDHFN